MVGQPVCHTIGMDTKQKLHSLGDRRRRLQAELDEIRPQLVDLIRAAAAEGIRQVEIVRATGYTREMVRRILRDGSAP